MYPYMYTKISTFASKNLIFLQGPIYWKIPPPPPWGEKKISADVIWGKKYERRKEIGENVKEKGRKGEEKGRKGKGNEKRGSKRVK